eukprot:TRINITY_DN21236_c0_g1_i2.p1 TRINITY_DN21236_c0_g1~~TRINITY_DN21236_c0_g1_i2.p1  ORF type:complete len:141 (+),score=28.66 TRINITY_DN21236_c0_g1_i2:260-682(+)
MGYKACATGNSLSYVLAFLGLGIAFGFSVLSSVGLLGYGGCGFLYAYFTQSLKGEALFIVTIVMAAMWVVQAVVFVAFIFFLRGWYKEDKASLASAKSQFTRGAARTAVTLASVSYTHLRAHETPEHLVCRLLLEKKKKY